jgi:hypothetical protein
MRLDVVAYLFFLAGVAACHVYDPSQDGNLVPKTVEPNRCCSSPAPETRSSASPFKTGSDSSFRRLRW